jgi:CheY-like chemotaxis protein
LTNLVSNAIKFTDEGEVVVHASLVEDGPEQVQVRFSVSDTGIGIAHSARHKLFQSFSQADGSSTRRYGGTGLGLAICKSLTELMGGVIDVESEPGMGSTFWFTVRLGKATSVRRATPETFIDLQGLRCLTVDDNETNRRIVNYQITSWGMQDGSAEDGKTALAKLRTAYQRGEPYDVVLLDMHMPEMDGAQLARAIKADPTLAGVKLVMLASISPQEQGYDISELDFAAYLTKPVRQSQLYNCLVSVMTGRQPALFSRPTHSQVTAVPVSAEEAARVRVRVLVAEDNVVNQKVAVRMIEKCGCQVDIAANGLEAIEALKQMKYDLVFMDCHMPEMDGYEATREIRRRETEGIIDRHIPIVALTANALVGDDEKCYAAGMDGYIAKPVKIEQIRALLQKWAPGASVGAM